MSPSAVTVPSPAPPADSIAAGTVLRLVSGETDEAIDEATVTVAGRTYTSVAGMVTLVEKAPLRSELAVQSPGILERHTLLRDPSQTRFTLWPARSPTGIDEGYTQALVYTQPNGPNPLWRLARGTTNVVVVPSADIRADDGALKAHQEAADRVSAATGGQVVYVLGSQRPASGVYVETRFDVGDPTCAQPNVLAFERGFVRGYEIVRAEIVFCDYKVARTPSVTHEMGHTFGLFHSPDKGELMYAYYNGHGSVDFSPRESLEMRLMLQRPGGNVFPDDDRAVTASTVMQTHVTICRTASP